MLDPITNQIAAQAAHRVAVSRRPEEARAKSSGKGRAAESDRFETILGEVEALGPVRALADADQEEAREDRIEHRSGATDQRGHEDRPGGVLDLTA